VAILLTTQLCCCLLTQVSCLDDDGLLSEFTALQMLALYNVNPGGTATCSADTNKPLDTDDARQAREQILTDCKRMDEELEEFMLQQVSALHVIGFRVVTAQLPNL
jgi:hypothetical protein